MFLCFLYQSFKVASIWFQSYPPEIKPGHPKSILHFDDFPIQTHLQFMKRLFNCHLCQTQSSITSNHPTSWALSSHYQLFGSQVMGVPPVIISLGFSMINPPAIMGTPILRESLHLWSTTMIDNGVVTNLMLQALASKTTARVEQAPLGAFLVDVGAEVSGG